MEHMKTNTAGRVIVGALILTAVAAAACGGGGGAKSPSGGSTPTGSTPVAPTSVAAAAAKAPATTAGPLALLAANVLFDRKDLRAAAGSVTIDLDNRDSGVPHNVHVFGGKDATGASVGATDLAAGPIKQTLKVELAMGLYFYQCDVHPTTMTGTITVE